eukprot:SAG11_NODE_175_length_13457_cov_42.095673_2_plen_149_part_00
MDALHVLLYLLVPMPSALRPLYAVYVASAFAIGSTCGFVRELRGPSFRGPWIGPLTLTVVDAPIPPVADNAAHRRNHNLPIFIGIQLLQDIGLLLHPAVHAAHHRGKHDVNYSLFSGITHPFTNVLLRYARDHKYIPLTDEHFRARLD